MSFYRINKKVFSEPLATIIIKYRLKYLNTFETLFQNEKVKKVKKVKIFESTAPFRVRRSSDAQKSIKS